MTTRPDSCQEDFERFQQTTSRHDLTIQRDDGLYRHLQFKRPKSYCESFSIVTWPGHLCFTGDMGTFVFSRLPDMFDFFRGPQTWRIDYRYWAEKLQASDKYDGYQKFSPELFAQRVKETFQDWLDPEFCQTTADEIWERIEDEVLSQQHEGEQSAIEAAMRFEIPELDNKHIFQDFWEVDCREFTHRFLWCCWAIRFAIEAYDMATSFRDNTGDCNSNNDIPQSDPQNLNHL